MYHSKTPDIEEAVSGIFVCQLEVELQGLSYKGIFPAFVHILPLPWSEQILQRQWLQIECIVDT